MPVTMTFSGDTVSEVFAQMREALREALREAPRDDRPVSDSMREAIDTSLLKLHKAAEAAMANAEQYDADKAAKEQLEKELSAEATKATRQRKPKEEPAADGVALSAMEHPSTSDAAPDDIAESALETVEVELPAATLDYTKDIAPAVLAYANANGREKTLALLEEFGATNAKAIPQAMWPELLARLA